jgi:putative membrane protein
MMGMMEMMGAGWMSAFMWVNFLIGLGLVALIVVGVVVGIRWLMKSPNPSGARGSERALEILREQYARGEISRDEFERMRQDLSSRLTPSVQ